MAQDESASAPKALDSMLVNIDQSSVKTGIIYERTYQKANLYNYNSKDYSHTAEYSFFRQSLLEMHRASNATKFISLEQLEELLHYSYADNIVEIGILNTEFNVLNYNEDEPLRGGMTLDTIAKRFTAIPDTEPFYTMHTVVIAPLMNAVGGADIRFNFSNQFLFTNGGKKITTLDVDFGEGTVENIIDNEIFYDKSITIQYGTSGTKIIKFLITFDDATTLETNGAIYFTNTTLGAGGTASCGSTGAGDLREDFLARPATIDSQGYIATDPKIKAQLDYRVFYGKDNTQKLIKKPLIIIDGFDPGDKRRIEDCDCEVDPKCASDNRDENGNFDYVNYKSIVDKMSYFENDEELPLLEELRFKGFDVIVVNFPKYQTTNLLNNQLVDIDGGADYIENNAMAVVALLQDIKGQVVKNGSTSKTAIISPSMAGQIARYALSYMEKKFEETGSVDWEHNVSLWASLDSPFLGANIPLGDQALIYLLRNADDAAHKFYYKELSSPASQQMLIEFHRPKQTPHPIIPNLTIFNSKLVDSNFLNGQTTSQGLPLDRGNSFFQEHYNKQYSSGILDSEGWPQNLRKIAIVNGSLTGSKEALKPNGQYEMSFANDGEKVLNIRGFQKIQINLLFGTSITWRIHIASLEAMFLKSTGQNGRIARFKSPSEKNTQATNINNRGVMDNAPGGYFDVQNQLAEPIIATLPLDGTSWISSFKDFSITNILYTLSQSFGGSEFQLREFNPINSFIPTFSSLAILNPNQSWATPLNYNLTCPSNKLTPFDSYFGIAKNTAHISFTKESKDWLLKELEGTPQAPSFPLNTNDLSGPEVICTTATYSFGDICKIPSNATWTKSSNLQITGSNGISVSVTKSPSGSGVGFIKATFQNGQTIIKNVWVGKPQITTIENCFLTQAQVPNPNVPVDPNGTIPPLPCASVCKSYFYSVENTYNLPFTGSIDQIEIEEFNTNFEVFASGYKIYIQPHTLGYVDFRFRATNSCGSTEWLYFKQKIVNCGSNQSQNVNMYTIYPNPSNNIINISLKDSNYQPTTNTTVSGELYDLNGQPKGSVQINNNQASFSVAGLLPGIYVLNIYFDGQVEGHQVYVE
jgi:hypothetical protein